MNERTAAGDYQMRHRPAPPEDGAPLHDLTNIYPDDVYTHPHHYILTHEPYERRAMNIAQQVRGKPEAMVQIYRALPKEHAHEGIHPGDWVGIDHEYAKVHGMQDDPKDDWPVISATVPAKHLYTSGDSISEWGYHGPETVGATTKTASADSGMLPNPYHQNDGFHHTWFHGSADVEGTDPTLDSPSRYKEEDFAGPGRGHGGPQTNKILGTHFTSLYAVGHHFSRPARNLDHSRIFHANLAMKNPAYFPDENTLDRHIFRHAMEHHPEFADDEDFNREQRWQGMSTPRTLAERDRQMGDTEDPEKHHARYSIDASMSRAIQMHPKQREIAKSFVDRLKSEGHDGIVYGNIVEGPKFHHCAIAFHPDDIHITEAERPTSSRLYHPEYYKDEDEQRLGDIHEQHTGVRERYGPNVAQESRTNLDHGPWTPYNGKHVLTPYQAALAYEQLPLHPDLPTGMPDRGVIKGNPQLPIYRAMSVHHGDREFDDFMDENLGKSHQVDQKIGERLMGHITAPKSDRGTPIHVGLHWTHDKDWAEDFAHHAHGMYEGNGEDEIGTHRPVIVEAHHPGLEHAMSWDNPADHKPLTNTVGEQKYDSAMLGEVPIRPGAPLHIKALHVKRADGSFHRIPMNMHHQAALGDLSDDQRQAFADHFAEHHPHLDASNGMADWLHKADHHLAGDATMGPRRGQPSMLGMDHPHPASIDPYVPSWRRQAALEPVYRHRYGRTGTEEEGQGIAEALHPETGEVIGALRWDLTGDPPTVIDMSVDEAHRRQGIGSRLFDLAKSKDSTLQHSDILTDDGRAFRNSMEKRSGLHGELPEGLFTTYRNIDGKHFVVGHVPQPDGAEPKMVGHLSMDGDPGDESHPVSGAWVHPAYRRRGVAGALWNAAKEMGFHPQHTPDEQTEDGAAWSQRVAGANGPDYEGLTFDDLDSPGWPHTHGHRLLRAHHPEHGMVGALYYDNKKNNLSIGRLSVPPEHQRRGVASAMMRELEARYPGRPIDHGMRSDDGHAWAQSMYGTPIPENLREKQNWTVNGKEAGLNGPDYDDLTYSTAPDHAAPNLFLLRAHHPEHGIVGDLHYDVQHHEPPLRPTVVNVHNLEVHPDHQRRGVATSLMRTLESTYPGAAINHGVRSGQGHEWAHGFYGSDVPEDQQARDYDEHWTRNGKPIPASEGLHPYKYEASVRNVSDAASDGDGIVQGMMIAVVPPRDLAERLAIEGGEDPEQLHITLAYLGQTGEYDGQQLADLKETVAAWAEAHEPLTATVQGAGTFVKAEEEGQHVLWASVDAPGLERLHVSLVDYLLERGYHPRMNHVFVPHMTLSYERHHVRFLPKIERETWDVSEVWVCIAGRWESVTLAAGGTDEQRHAAARTDAGRRNRGGDPAPSGEPGDPGPVGDGQGAPRPLTLHPRVEKDLRGLHPQDQRMLRDAMDRLAAGDPTLDTHPLTLKLKGWYATKASRGHRIVHRPDGQGGIYVGYVGLHDYDKAINRLTSALSEVFVV